MIAVPRLSPAASSAGRAQVSGGGRQIAGALVVVATAGCFGQAVVTVYDDAGAGGQAGATASTVGGGGAGGGGSCGADLSSDPSHCGRCDHACQGGTCLDGACQPVVLAADLDGPTSIAVDASRVYWRDHTPIAIHAVPLGGGEPIVLASYIESEHEHLAIGAGHAYFSGWIDDGAQWLQRVPLAGGEVTKVAVSGGGVMAMAVDAASVYWLDIDWASSLSLWKVALGGGEPATLATGLTNASALVASDTGVYWTSWDEGKLWRLPLGGGSPAVVAAGQNHPADLVVRGGMVYWLNHGTVDGSGPPDGSVMRASVDGQGVAVLVPAAPSPAHLAVDDIHLYWTSCKGEVGVMTVPLSGGEAAAFAIAGGCAWGVAIDATSVYWTEPEGTAAGRVMKKAK